MSTQTMALEKPMSNKKEKVAKVVRNAALALNTVMLYADITAMKVFAIGGDDVTITDGTGVTASQMMGRIIGIMLTITRFAGVGLVLFGVYEIVMSFMQQQPEAKTKGIIMALSGVVMIALKSILQAVGVLGGGAAT